MLKCNCCGSELVSRTNKKTKKQFMGCSKYPLCKGQKVNYEPFDYDSLPSEEEYFEQATRDFDEWHDRMKRLHML